MPSPAPVRWSIAVVTCLFATACAGSPVERQLLASLETGDERLLEVRRALVVAGPPPTEVLAPWRGHPDGTAAVSSWAFDRPGHEALSLQGARVVADRLRRRGLVEELRLADSAERARPVEVVRVVPFAARAQALELARELDADLVAFVVVGQDHRKELWVYEKLELRRATWLHLTRRGAATGRMWSTRGLTTDLPARAGELRAEGDEARQTFERLLHEVDDDGCDPALLASLRAAGELLLQDEGPLTPAQRDEVVRGLVVALMR
jgi:hypothetical protein